MDKLTRRVRLHKARILAAAETTVEWEKERMLQAMRRGRDGHYWREFILPVMPQKLILEGREAEYSNCVVPDYCIEHECALGQECKYKSEFQALFSGKLFATLIVPVEIRLCIWYALQEGMWILYKSGDVHAPGDRYDCSFWSSVRRGSVVYTTTSRLDIEAARHKLLPKGCIEIGINPINKQDLDLWWCMGLLEIVCPPEGEEVEGSWLLDTRL